MNIDDVPQDAVATFKGYGRKAMYALGPDGRYCRVKSSGWEVEETVLRDVVQDFQERARHAAEQVRQGRTAPIEYFMHLKLMDLQALAGGVGLPRWRVKRHMKPHIFAKLKPDLLKRYADFFQISLDDLIRFAG